MQAGTNFCDLGGNTEIVFQQKELDADARKAKVTIVPDCGLAPGMVNILAQYGIEQLDDVKSVKIFVGGLPQHPEGPLELPDRVLARGRARLLHDAVVDRAQRKARRR